MAPRAGVGRRTATASPQAYRELGVQGRKTGLTLPDRGARDEHGMQPLEDIFSSPRKSQRSSSARSNRTPDDSGSEDMEIASSTGPGPRTVLRQSNPQFPIPRSRSPIKTNLKSPARKNPRMGRPDSAERDVTVTRKIDFAAKSSGPKRGQLSKAGASNGLNGTLHEDHEDSDDDDDDVEFGDHPPTDDIINHSMDIVNEINADSEDDLPLVGDDQYDDDDDRFLGAPARPIETKRSPKRPSSKQPVEDDGEEDVEGDDADSGEDDVELPPPRKGGRPSKKDAKLQALAKARATKKRRSLEAAEAEDDAQPDEQPQSKRQRTTAPVSKSAKGKAPATAKPAGKPGRPKGGRPKKVQVPDDDGEVGDTSMAALQRGPPMPKARGLVSVRHDEDGLKQTRSGRHSYRPLAFWRGEAAVAEREDYDDMFQKDRHFVLPSVKEIVRVEPDVAPSKRAPRSKSRAKTKTKTQAQEEDEELEEWEMQPGTMNGEVVLWEPEHELQPPAEDEPVHIAEEQIAISGDAVQTRDIRDATFRFAKTLTMPFMGAGIVDLPPGAEKRPKNSRKMHMVFFVHYGKVMVTVNEAQFRISPGGTWFVPRGNYYSITNDYDNPARIFFSQACEVPAQPVDLEEE